MISFFARLSSPPVASLLLIVTLAVASIPVSSVPGRGFGDSYEWLSLTDGLKQVEETGKEGVILFHKSWCGACKDLGPQVSEDGEMLEIAKEFVMMNVYDDEEPDDEKWRPDGAAYVPRILFYNRSGVMVNQVNSAFNTHEEYKYHYSSAVDIRDEMKTVLAKRKEKAANDKEEAAKKEERETAEAKKKEL